MGRRDGQAPAFPTPVCLLGPLPPPPCSWKGPGGFDDANACLSCTFPSRRQHTSGWKAGADDGRVGPSVPSVIVLGFFNAPVLFILKGNAEPLSSALSFGSAPPSPETPAYQVTAWGSRCSGPTNPTLSENKTDRLTPP